MYDSRTLTYVKKRYWQTEKEALGLIWEFKRFEMYLVGSTFELWTDHRSLEFFYGLSSSNQLQK